MNHWMGGQEGTVGSKLGVASVVRASVQQRWHGRRVAVGASVAVWNSLDAQLLGANKVAFGLIVGMN
jgi:hypothetical protein